MSKQHGYSHAPKQLFITGSGLLQHAPTASHMTNFSSFEFPWRALHSQEIKQLEQSVATVLLH